MNLILGGGRLMPGPAGGVKLVSGKTSHRVAGRPLASIQI